MLLTCLYVRSCVFLHLHLHRLPFYFFNSVTFLHLDVSQPKPYSIQVSAVSITVCDIACAVCEKERAEKDLVMAFMLLFMIKSDFMKVSYS